MKWYTGTASAIYQNLNYLSQYEPEYVLILSGDHIYKMDYSKMLDYHIEKESGHFLLLKYLGMKRVALAL